MGSLGFLTPFQFYASDDKCSSTGNGTGKGSLLKVPVYRSAVEKVMRGKNYLQAVTTQ